LQVLVNRGVASEDELRVAFAEGMGSGERFGEVVLRHGWLDEVGLARALAQQWDLPYLEHAGAELDHQAAAALNMTVAEELEACAVRAAGGEFVVAVAEPTEERLAGIRAAMGNEVSIAVVAKTTLDDLLGQAHAEGSLPAAEPTSLVDDDEGERPLQRLNRELELTLTQLATLREHVACLATTDERNKRERSQLEARLVELTTYHAASEERIRILETQLVEQRDRIAVARAALEESSGALDT
jgi:hypothetical protein